MVGGAGAAGPGYCKEVCFRSGKDGNEDAVGGGPYKSW
jgi:hypothetical protein